MTTVSKERSKMPHGALMSFAALEGIGSALLSSGMIAQSVVPGVGADELIKTVGIGGAVAVGLWAVLRTIWTAFERMVTANQTQLDMMRAALNGKDERIASLVDAHTETMHEHLRQTVEQVSVLASARTDATGAQRDHTRAMSEQTIAVKELRDEIRQSQARICHFRSDHDHAS